MELPEIKKILEETYSFLKGEDLELFLGICSHQLFSKRSKFIRAGENSGDAFFILKGMFRGYFINKSGEEKNIFLRQERTVSAAPENILMGIATQYTFEAVVDSHLLIFNYEEMIKLASENKSIFKLHHLALQENLITLIGRVQGLIDSTPEERYEALLEQSPHFFQTALHKHIANYLGVTPNSLSRIIRRKSKS